MYLFMPSLPFWTKVWVLEMRLTILHSIPHLSFDSTVTKFLYFCYIWRWLLLWACTCLYQRYICPLCWHLLYSSSEKVPCVSVPQRTTARGFMELCIYCDRSHHIQGLLAIVVSTPSMTSPPAGRPFPCPLLLMKTVMSASPAVASTEGNTGGHQCTLHRLWSKNHVTFDFLPHLNQTLSGSIVFPSRRLPH